MSIPIIYKKHKISNKLTIFYLSQIVYHIVLQQKINTKLNHSPPQQHSFTS